MISLYNDSAEQAGQVARCAIPLASKLGLPINPHIYAVCYQYTAQLNHELCKAFDKLLEKDPKPNQSMVELLYHEHIIDDDEKAFEITQKAVASVMNSTEGALKTAEENTKAYGQTLSNAAEELNELNEPSDLIKNIVKSLAEDTMQMNTATQALKEQLSSAKEEMAQLQEEYSRIREESLTDPLTSLKNRRAFDESFETICNDSVKNSNDTCLLVVDIDHFKKINDTFGHSVGDAVLKCVGKILKGSVRGDDVAARFGGEEFTVILPDTPLEGARKVAEKIRNTIAAQKLRHSNKDLGPVTVSIGVSKLNPPENNNLLFERADAALYQAKTGGRNQVCIG